MNLTVRLNPGAPLTGDVLDALADVLIGLPEQRPELGGRLVIQPANGRGRSSTMIPRLIRPSDKAT